VYDEVTFITLILLPCYLHYLLLLTDR